MELWLEREIAHHALGGNQPTIRPSSAILPRYDLLFFIRNGRSNQLPQHHTIHHKTAKNARQQKQISRKENAVGFRYIYMSWCLYSREETDSSGMKSIKMKNDGARFGHRLSGNRFVKSTSCRWCSVCFRVSI